jgi:transcriptional regulator with XRE-family HTH domain
MQNNIKSHMKRTRLNRLPESFSREMKAARKQLDWSQAELGRQVGLPQTHISGIETGRIVPRFDTLLDLVRVLGLDLVLVPRSLVPAIQALVRDARNPDAHKEDRPLYAVTDDEPEDADDDGPYHHVEVG